jgi:hypothetical protein
MIQEGGCSIKGKPLLISRPLYLLHYQQPFVVAGLGARIPPILWAVTEGGQLKDLPSCWGKLSQELAAGVWPSTTESHFVLLLPLMLPALH